MFEIKAAARLLASDDLDSIIKDLKSVGFKAIKSKERGVLEIQELSAEQCKQLCDKLLKVGYKSQGATRYPDQEDGGFYLVKGDTNLGVDPDGYVHVA